MKQYTIQCGYNQGYGNTVTVEAETIEEACRKAIEQANDESSWRSYDGVGETYIERVVEGEHQSAWDDGATAVDTPPKHAEEAVTGSTVKLPQYGAAIRIVNGKLYYGPCNADGSPSDFEPSADWLEINPRDIAIMHADAKRSVAMLSEAESNLCAELRTWCNQRNLPFESADELMARDDVRSPACSKLEKAEEQTP